MTPAAAPLCDCEQDLLVLAEAYRAALDAGLRLARPDGRRWVRLGCGCGCFMTVPARPLYPVDTARRLVLFVRAHEHPPT